MKSKRRIQPQIYPLSDSIKSDSRLDGTLIPHTLQTFGPLIQFERLIDDAADFDLSAIQVIDGGWEHVHFGEGAQDGDFIPDWSVIIISFSTVSRDVFVDDI